MLTISNNLNMKLIRLLILFVAMASTQISYAKWDEEKIGEFKSEEVKTYYYKINSQGHKLVLDSYMKRLIFIQKDKTFKRNIDGIKIDGEYVEAWGDYFSNYPQQTAVLFNDKDAVMERLKNAKKIEINVVYFKDGERVSTFKIK